MPNSTASARADLLAEIGADTVEALFAQIPDDHRLKGPIGLPPAEASEAALSRAMRDMLAKNVSCEQALSFLGGGVWRHHVPAACDEIVRRSEFLTPVWGTSSSDHGRNQAWFEFQSMLGALLDMEFVGLPVYSWGCAIGHALRIAARMTGRSVAIVPRYLSPERRKVIESYCQPAGTAGAIRLVEIGVDAKTGRIDLDALRAAAGADTAAIYLETPSFLGVIESGAEDVAAIARRAGAEFIVGVDPVSLGALAPPGAYGADIAVGSIQPLGVHMSCGGGLGGFIASRDEARYAREYPTLNLSIAPTARAGEVGFGMSLMHQSSYGSRELGKDWTGNSTYLHAIAGAVYMALMGPDGMRELGETIVQRAHFAASLISGVKGARIVHPAGFFKEFVVDFSASGRSVADINRRLLADGIFGGLDLSADFPELGAAALYCVTELHGEADLRRLAKSLEGALRS